MIGNISMKLKSLADKINKFHKLLMCFVNLLFFIATYILFIVLDVAFSIEVRNKVIFHGIFIFFIILVTLNCFRPRLVQSFLSSLGKLAFSVVITLSLLFSYLLAPFIGTLLIEIDLYTLTEIIIYYTLFIITSTLLSGLGVWFLRKKPSYILSKLQGSKNINVIFIEEFYDKWIDNLIRILYLTILILSGSLTFIISFVPVFFDMVDINNIPLNFKEQPIFFAVLVVLLQAVFHGQIVDVVNKIHNSKHD
ncbi:Uncharacterised protein [Mycobacteroides abscessus subsp. abscessus]|nr:Uncharacterised protein [Mycobacteroides abscessus subsp. abscessus]